MRWLITPLQPEHGFDAGTVVACWAALILSSSCLYNSSSPYSPCVELFLNQSKAWDVESA